MEPLSLTELEAAVTADALRDYAEGCDEAAEDGETNAATYAEIARDLLGRVEAICPKPTMIAAVAAMREEA